MEVAEELNRLTAEQKKVFDQASNNLRCPTCTGLSILQSDAPFSLQIRKAVIEQVSMGKNYDEIIKFFTERYGLWILREPPTEGFHFLAWFIPLSILLLGPFFIWFFIWRKRAHISTFGIRATQDIADEFHKKLAELKR